MMHASFTNKEMYNTWIRALWGTARSFGMSDELVRDVAEQVTGGRSISAMSMDGFKAWFARVEEIYGEKPKRRMKRTKKRDSSSAIIEIATPEQKAFIRTFARKKLRWQKGWNEAGTECSSISKIIEKHTKGRKREIRQLTLQEARSVIEALKKIYERKRGPESA